MRRVFLTALGLLFCSAALSANDGAQRLTRFLDGLNTLQAEFLQTVMTTGQNQTVTSRGTFYLSRPGRFLWTYDEPEGQFVVADGSRVWLYDADLEQVSHQSQDEALKGTPALLLSDTGPVDRHFEVVDLGSRIGLEWVELIPRAEDSEIIKVQVAFRGDQLDRLEMIDSFGQVTRFEFRRVKRNPKLASELFRFDPPPAIDILGR